MLALPSIFATHLPQAIGTADVVTPLLLFRDRTVRFHSTHDGGGILMVSVVQTYSGADSGSVRNFNTHKQDYAVFVLIDRAGSAGLN